MIRYRLATKADNQQLIDLTAASGMTGETALRIERSPDFFALLDMRGKTKVFVALDGNSIVGSLCVSLQQVYVGGEIFPLQYIGDFKVSAAYRNQGVGLHLCDGLANYVIAEGSDLAFLNVSKGNTRPVSFFKGRPNVPDFDKIGIFNIHQFIGKKTTSSHARYKVESADLTDDIICFLNKHYSRYQLGPVIDNGKLEGTDIFAIRVNNKIVAIMCLSDTMNMKQNVVTALSWKTRWPLKLINSFSDVYNISKMPMINEPVRMMYIKYLAVENHQREMVKLMVNHARNIVYEKSYSFASIGLHEKDPFNKCFSGLFKFTFNSVGMLLSIKDNRELIETVKQGIPFEDYSLV